MADRVATRRALFVVAALLSAHLAIAQTSVIVNDTDAPALVEGEEGRVIQVPPGATVGISALAARLFIPAPGGAGWYGADMGSSRAIRIDEAFRSRLTAEGAPIEPSRIPRIASGVLVDGQDEEWTDADVVWRDEGGPERFAPAAFDVRRGVRVGAAESALWGRGGTRPQSFALRWDSDALYFLLTFDSPPEAGTYVLITSDDGTGGPAPSVVVDPSASGIVIVRVDAERGFAAGAFASRGARYEGWIDRSALPEAERITLWSGMRSGERSERFQIATFDVAR